MLSFFIWWTILGFCLIIFLTLFAFLFDEDGEIKKTFDNLNWKQNLFLDILIGPLGWIVQIIKFLIIGIFWILKKLK